MSKKNLVLPASDGACVELPSAIQDRIKKHTQALTMLPQHAISAMEHLDDPNVPAKIISEFIQQEITLAADILSIANSAIFSCDRPVDNLTDAISRIGASRCKNIIITSSIKSAMRQMDLEEEWIKEVFTKHGFLTAVIASRLNIELDCRFNGEEFAAGLIHDFGRLLLAVSFSENFAEFDPMDFDESPEILTREECAIGTNHCDVGAWFVTKQGLPPALADVVRFHHTPENSLLSTKLTTLVACADHMASHYQRFAESEAYQADSSPYPAQLESVGVKDAQSKLMSSAGELLNLCADEANGLTGM